jgi:hypothetical protein
MRRRAGEPGLFVLAISPIFLRNVVLRKLFAFDLARSRAGCLFNAAHNSRFKRLPFIQQFFHALGVCKRLIRYLLGATRLPTSGRFLSNGTRPAAQPCGLAGASACFFARRLPLAIRGSGSGLLPSARPLFSHAASLSPPYLTDNTALNSWSAGSSSAGKALANLPQLTRRPGLRQ